MASLRPSALGAWLAYAFLSYSKGINPEFAMQDLVAIAVIVGMTLATLAYIALADRA